TVLGREDLIFPAESLISSRSELTSTPMTRANCVFIVESHPSEYDLVTLGVTDQATVRVQNKLPYDSSSPAVSDHRGQIRSARQRRAKAAGNLPTPTGQNCPLDAWLCQLP